MSVLAWLAILLFIFGCESKDEKERRAKIERGTKQVIKVNEEAIFFNNKKIASTITVEQQDSLLVEALYKVLREAREIENEKGELDDIFKIRVHLAPNISYDVLYKIIATGGISGYTNIYMTSKIDGKDYIEEINLPERTSISDARRIFLGLKSKELNLTISIFNDSIEVWACGSRLPKNPIDYNELMKLLITLRNQHKDLPDIDKAIILPYDDTEVGKLIQVMEKARITGFFKTNLAKVHSFTKKDSIRHEKQLENEALKRGITKEELLREEKQRWDELRRQADSIAKTSISIEEIREMAMNELLPPIMFHLVASKRYIDSIKVRAMVEKEILVVEDSLKIISDKLLCKNTDGKGVCPELLDTAKLSGSAYDLMAGKIDPYTPEYYRLSSLRDSYRSRYDSLKLFLNIKK